MSKVSIQEFQALYNLTDLADLLGFPPKILSFILYKLHGGPNGQYTEFEVKKRSGGTRIIAAPHTGLKAVQKKLATNLQDIYMVKKSVHGFVRKRNILTNAQNHSRKRYVFNIDLKDFFPSIHFGRVMGLFASKPYEFRREIAIIIAKIACLNDVLPQGSPCSPIISNMICGYMDKQLGSLAKDCGCFYTRYADDLTFSTNRSTFPAEIAVYAEGKWEPSSILTCLINEHSFQINEEKTSMRTRSDRQLVTGIVVNEYPNIQRKLLKQVRSMLHDWKVNGAEKAQKRYLAEFDLANREPPKVTTINFEQVVRGKLEHIRQIRSHRVDALNRIREQECIRNRARPPQKGEQHTIYKDQYYKYFRRFEQLTIRDRGIPTILGEGETDWMHLRKAYAHFKRAGDYAELDLHIHKHKTYAVGGIDYLKDFCKNAEQLYVEFPFPVICVFDGDIPGINAEHSSVNDGYIAHGNNVYSMVLPKPQHRQTDTYAIEQLYKNDDLLKVDGHKRRLYLNTEFNRKSGQLKTNHSVVYGIQARNGEKIKNWQSTLRGDEKIIDSDVCIEIGGKFKNIALTKKDFVLHIIKNESPFDKMDFSGFKAVFDLIQKICSL